MECRPKVGFEGPEGWIRGLICTSQAAIETKEMLLKPPYPADSQN